MIAVDTNILIYSVVTSDLLGRHAQAIELLKRIAPVGGIVPLQVIGEFLAVCTRKKTLSPALAIQRISEFMGGFDCPPTDAHDLIDAFDLANKKRLQFFDALIIAVAHRAGATLLLSEDMHDGLEVDGLRVVNPFVAGNDAVIANYLPNS